MYGDDGIRLHMVCTKRAHVVARTGNLQAAAFWTQDRFAFEALENPAFRVPCLKCGGQHLLVSMEQADAAGGLPYVDTDYALLLEGGDPSEDSRWSGEFLLPRREEGSVRADAREIHRHGLAGARSRIAAANAANDTVSEMSGVGLGKIASAMSFAKMPKTTKS